MSIATTRTCIADTLSGQMAGWRIKTDPPKTVKNGDGWITANRISASEYLRTYHVEFEVVVILGQDEVTAMGLFEQWAPLVINALTLGDLPSCGDVQVTPTTAVVGSVQTTVPAMSVTFSMEVSGA